MDMKSVKSSSIKAIGHDPATNTLRVEFGSGATHDYEGVSAEKHAELIAAPSVGKHFHAHIRNAHANKRVDDGTAKPRPAAPTKPGAPY